MKETLTKMDSNYNSQRSDLWKSLKIVSLIPAPNKYLLMGFAYSNNFLSELSEIEVAISVLQGCLYIFSNNLLIDISIFEPENWQQFSEDLQILIVESITMQLRSEAMALENYTFKNAQEWFISNKHILNQAGLRGIQVSYSKQQDSNENSTTEPMAAIDAWQLLLRIESH